MPQPKKEVIAETGDPRGRPLSALTTKLLNNPGVKVRVPWSTPKPDKTVRDYGYRFHYTKDPKHPDSLLFWIDEA